MEGEQCSAGIANESKLLLPSRQEKRERKEGRNEKPRITSRDKKIQRNLISVESEYASLFCNRRGRKIHKVQIN